MKLPEIAVLPVQQSEKVTGVSITPVMAPESDAQKNVGNVQSQADLEQATKKLNDTLSAFNIQERFVLDNKSGKVVVYLIDTAKHEIIRRIPPEQVLNAASTFQKYLGLFLNELI